jgi:anaerobic selenocysteine-containing dehydrogenase
MSEAPQPVARAEEHALPEIDRREVVARLLKIGAVSRRMHREVVGLQHGFGHWAGGRNAIGRGTSDATLRPALADPLAGQSLHKENCVTIRKA